jgi:16S rRNA (guanine527-N7)-methyltransferase
MAAMEQLRLQAHDWGIRLGRSQLSLLSDYADLLARYELANVIGTRDRDKIILEHLSDALSCYTVEDLRWANSVIDIGSGGGLPGVPLGIVRSELRVVLLEAVEKKVRFLEYARAALGLQNIEVLHARAEDVGKKPAYREAFDLATARALAALPVIVEYCAPFVRTGGTILAMKGRLPEEELSRGIAASRELGVELREVREVKYRAQLPQKERRLVVLDKVDATADRFPRRVGLAKKRPLGA